MRFRPYFTIRDLFWLTLVAAILTVWWLEHPRVAESDLWRIERLGDETVVRDHKSGRTIESFADKSIVVIGGKDLTCSEPHWSDGKSEDLVPAPDLWREVSRSSRVDSAK